MAETGESGGLAAYRAKVAAGKRAAILDAAARLFIDGGYGGTTLEAVAREAEVSTGTLFKHFPTKAALFGGIMARLWEAEEEPAAAPSGDAAAVLTAIGYDYAGLLGSPQVVGLFRVIIAEALRFPELGAELYQRGKAPYLARVDAALLATVGEAGGAETRARAAREFLGMINDQVFWPRLLVVDYAPSAEEVERVVASAVGTFLSRYG